MYFATILDFVLFNDAFFEDYEEADFLAIYEGRCPWSMYDYEIEGEVTYRLLSGSVLRA